jgi:hypothetical protein
MPLVDIREGCIDKAGIGPTCGVYREKWGCYGVWVGLILR